MIVQKYWWLINLSQDQKPEVMEVAAEQARGPQEEKPDTGMEKTVQVDRVFQEASKDPAAETMPKESKDGGGEVTPGTKAKDSFSTDAKKSGAKDSQDTQVEDAPDAEENISQDVAQKEPTEQATGEAEEPMEDKQEKKEQPIEDEPEKGTEPIEDEPETGTEPMEEEETEAPVRKCHG